MGMFGMGGKKPAAPPAKSAPGSSSGAKAATGSGSGLQPAQSTKTKRVIAPGAKGPVQPGKSATVKVVAKPQAQVQVSKAVPAQPATRPITAAHPAVQAAGADDEVGSLAKARGGAPCRTGDKALIEFLVGKTKLLTADQVAQAIAVAEQESLPIDLAVVKQNLLTEDLLVNALTQECYVPHLKVDKYEIRKKALDTISKDDAQFYGVFPVDKLGSLLTLAMVNPLDQETIRVIESKTGLDVKRVVATRSEILQGIDKYYGGKVQAKDHSLAFTNDAPNADGKPGTSASAKTKAAGSVKKPSVKTSDGIDIEDIDDLLLGDEVIAPVSVKPIKADEPPMVVPAADILEISDGLPGPATPALEARSKPAPGLAPNKLRTPTPVAPSPEFLDDQLDLGPTPSIRPGTARLPAIGGKPPSTSGVPAASASQIARAIAAQAVQLIPVLDDEFKHAITHGKAHVFEKWVGLQTRNRIINALPVDPELDPVLAPLAQVAKKVA